MRLSWLKKPSQVQNRNTMINNLTDNIKKLNDNIQHLASTVVCAKNSLQTLKQKLNLQQQNMDKFKSDQNRLLIQKQMEDMVHTSYDGTLLWRISGVAQKLGE
jgi:chromosome segregation ATPase